MTADRKKANSEKAVVSQPNRPQLKAPQPEFQPVQEPLETLLRRVELTPHAMTSAEATRLQRAIGNRALGALHRNVRQRQPGAGVRRELGPSPSLQAILNRSAAIAAHTLNAPAQVARAGLVTGPMLHRPQPGPIIQRDFDDEKQLKVDRNALSAIWGKFKSRSEGGDGFPDYAKVAAWLKPLEGEQTTERKLAERIATIPEIRTILVAPRLKKAGELPKGEKPEEAIKRIIRATLYYHATFEKNVPDIVANGLKAKKGGSGTGISTHARGEGQGGAAAQATYNKWSEGHVFITPSKREADGYASKMAERAGEKTKVIHIFADPDWAAGEIKVDVDSKAGLKTDGDMKLVGDGDTLNQRALNLIFGWLRYWGHLAVKESEITEAYRALVATA